MPVRRKIKNSVGHYSRAELLVREATSNDSSMPSQELLLQIADMTMAQTLYTDTTSMIWKRLNDKCKNWRHIYKALFVIEACLQYGSMQFSKECYAQLPQILTLCDFVYVYDQNSNAGFLIREKAQRIAALLKDANLLKQERHAARMSRPKDKGSSPNYTRRARSVYNPSDEYVARTESEEREHLRLAMTLSLQDSFDNSATKSGSDIKPTLLESSRKASNTQTEDLHLLDDESLKSKRLNSWLESRFKPFASLSTSDLCTPSSSLIGPAPLTAEKWSVISTQMPLLSAPNGSQNSGTLTDLSGLDFDPLTISTPAEGPSLGNFGGTTGPDTTLVTLTPSTLPIHKTSADEYFESLARRKASTAIPATPAATAVASTAVTAAAFNTAILPKNPSTIIEQRGSKLSSMLGDHRDLVDLENICGIQKSPPDGIRDIFGDNSFNAIDNSSIPSMSKFGANGQPSLNWGGGVSLSTVQQPALTQAKELVPLTSQQLATHEPTWQALVGQPQLSGVYTSASTTNHVSVAGANPFL
ncbi:epsin 1 [Echinococcus multilocularis]|uniref:Epsin 1 n=1 Tax=Echinococcus multilocularis TaxID=6211 RepID=A0A068YNA0_ECHMU|nr:epsin 1 [Echinococcus multilocularis]